jgi:hypothetical protein
MPLQLSDEDKAEMDDTIGNLPILLNAPLEIKLDDLEDAEIDMVLAFWVTNWRGWRA